MDCIFLVSETKVIVLFGAGLPLQELEYKREPGAPGLAMLEMRVIVMILKKDQDNPVDPKMHSNPKQWKQHKS